MLATVGYFFRISDKVQKEPESQINPTFDITGNLRIFIFSFLRSRSQNRGLSGFLAHYA